LKKEREGEEDQVEGEEEKFRKTPPRKKSSVKLRNEEGSHRKWLQKKTGGTLDGVPAGSDYKPKKHILSG